MSQVSLNNPENVPVTNAQEGATVNQGPLDITSRTNNLVIEFLEARPTVTTIVPADKIDAAAAKTGVITSSSEKLLTTHIIKIRKIYRQIRDLRKAAKDWDSSEGSIAVSERRLNKKINALEDALGKILDLMEKVHDKLNKGKSKKACELYAAEMPLKYRAYCKALQEYKRLDREIAAYLKNENHELHLDDTHVRDPWFVAEKLYDHAIIKFPDTDKVFPSDDFRYINKAYNSYVASFQLADRAKERVEGLLDSEKELNGQLAEIIQSLSTEDDPNIDYLSATMKAKKECGYSIRRLEAALNHFTAGRIEEGIDYFALQADLSVGSHFNAYQELANQHKQAEARGMPYHLDLSQPKQQLRFLQEVRDDLKQHESRMDTTTWDASIAKITRVLT